MPDKELAQQLFHFLIKTKKFAKKKFVLPPQCPLTETQFKTLIILKKNPHITLGGLSAELNVSSSSLSIMLNKLVEDGWVERIYTKTDRRLTFFKLTPKGEHFVKTLIEEKIEGLRNDLKILSEKEKKELISSLETLEKIFAKL
ncbi:DNA-binding transcriptional regulator, MarR family [Anaerobranca californiensis DSM 14826]|jgi:DNA-binding MarR family transcriptional regulator|uniref:DNA-binding transcriptional regulator, MarR family n=1 Tax=Anaerobranca californiensis DSM 14826 TaxID=1120989 RepID=A0A1M6PXH7_9FIRM|nr:MarR family transcriptional regulator [Anaerobranca californiensis]SHK12630.1 DNA-binding transcriptional regulator, MarR family [Anaerobranca californiensis DSM 14826]